MQFAFLNRQPWRRVRQVLLVYSAGAFFLLIALVISDSRFLFIFGGILYLTGHAWLYLMLIGLPVVAFPVSVGLTFAAKSTFSPTVMIAVIAFSALTFSIAVPVIAVQMPYPVLHCHGTFTEWQSLSYYLIGFGSHVGFNICS